MNICFLTVEIPNLRSGGIENVTYRLACEFGHRGYEVHCMTFDSAPKEIGRMPFRLLCIGRDEDAVGIVDGYLSRNKIDIVVNQAVERRWQDVICRVKPNMSECRFIKVLHTDPAYMIKGVIDAGKFDIGCNCFSSLLYDVSPVTIIRRYKRRHYTKTLYASWIKLYDRIVLLSDNVIDDFKRLAGCNACHNVTAIGNPVDFGQSNCEAKEKLVLFVGRLHRKAKRPDRLLTVWQKIYKSHLDWKLVFVGDGPMREEMENHVRRVGLANVIFVGQTNPTDFFQKASILCMTSTYEGFPVVCGEALSHGVIPMAFSSFGAVKDLIRDGWNGVLVKPYSIDEYANKLSLLMSDSDYVMQLRKNIRNDYSFKQRFSTSTIVDKWESLFNELK